LFSLRWNESEYLKKLFRDVDINGDGTITFNELHSALARGQMSLQFDIKTAELLVNKYDTNHDGEINFHEFEHLFNYLNEEYFKFLLADTDGSSTIDSDELDEFFRQRGHKFNKDFCNFIINTIKSRAFGGVTFDYYCRLMARFDFLIHQHANYEYYKAMPLEKYLKGAFFSDFW
jgi:Ca2+-binding EF-hand superfamily protein